MTPFRFNLGHKVEDRVTHYRGKIAARAEYLYGPNTYLVEGLDTTNRPIEFWVTEDRLVSA